MGADAEIFVFDYERYRTEIVPALVTLLRTGRPVPWLAEIFRGEPSDGYGWSRMSFPPTDLAAHCDWLGDDLRYLGGRPSGLPSLSCTRVSCPETHHCPFHQDRHAVEELNALYEAVVATRCLGAGQFLGRSRDAYSYQAVLDRLAVAADDRVRELLAQLGSRGAVLGYQFANSDGVHGWLTPPETAELTARLGALPLPRFEASFAAMHERHRLSMSGPDDDWDAVSLAFVRTVSGLATDEGRGVLWGNDVIARIWTELYGVRPA